VEAPSSRTRNEVEDSLRASSAIDKTAVSGKGKSLVVLQVNCRSIYNKALEFSNVVDTYNPDVVIGTQSWHKEDIGNAEIFRDDFEIFRRDRCTRGGRVFICVKNTITCMELWVDKEYEMIEVEVKGRDLGHKWEIIGVYRAPNQGMEE
jgi:hypothetical protein